MTTKKKNFREDLLAKIRAEERSRPAADEELPPSRVRALVSARALRNNYHVLQEKCGSNTWMIPMVKANAYGHGIPFAVNALKAEQTLYAFGVATLEEGREVREVLGLRDRKKRVILFSGGAHWTPAKAAYCERYGIEPALHSRDDLASFLKHGGPSTLRYHLKFNSGMNRLGIPFSQLEGILKLLKNIPLEEWPETVCTHLAIAEDPKDATTLIQMTRFQEIRRQFRAKKETMLFHFANSSGCWNARHYHLSEISDIARPGLSLYGVPPFPGASQGELQPVMELQYQVLAVQDLSVGDRVGYGGTYRVNGKEYPNGQRIAILGAGYGDGLSRLQGNSGRVLSRARWHRFVGRVSMDLSAIEISSDGPGSLRVGDWVKFLGEGIDPWTQAESAGTIPYELLTSVSPRVIRVEQ